MKNDVHQYIKQALPSAVLIFYSCTALAGVEDVWNASPPTNDTVWAQQNARPVEPGWNGSGTRVQLWSGSSTTASMSIDSNITTVYATFDLDGRGVTQVMFDLQEAAARGDVRIYNRGGENADRPYDALIKVSKFGSTLTLRGEGIWTGAPVIKTVIGYGQ